MTDRNMATPGRYNFRLLVGLPIVVICFTLAAGLFPLGFIQSNSSSGIQLNPRFSLTDMRLIVVLVSALASVLAVMISLYIVRPVEDVIRGMEDLARRHGQTEANGGLETANEIDRLSKLYSKTIVPVRGYLDTADLLLQVSEGMIGLDASGKVTFMNASVERVLGVSRSQYTGKLYQELLPNSHRNAEAHSIIEKVWRTGDVETHDIVISGPAGKNVFVRMTVSRVTGWQKEALGTVLLFQDIKEISRLKEQLHRVDALASMGGAVTGMAHEVRTPLGYIRGLAELIKEDLPEEAPHRKYAQTIVEAIDRLNQLIEEILSLASIKVSDTETIDAKSTVRESIMYVRDLARTRDLKLVEDYPQTEMPVKADRQKLVESFVNIMKNACEAAPSGGRLNVCVRPVTMDQSTGSGADTVAVEFHNEGSYIPPEIQENIFTPFFTTKRQGTGLGLAISKRIIEAHGGVLQVESSPDSGTLFRVVLPAAKAVAAVAPESSVS